MNQAQLETLSSTLRQQWQGNRENVPSRVLVWVPDPGVYRVEDGGEVFLVIEDRDTIIRMMNQQGQVFSAVKSQCQDLDRQRQVLVCPRADMILCSGYTDNDLFVSDNLRPLLADANQDES